MSCITKTKVIPQNATIRLEYVKCGNPDCTEKHGPYLYAYWKENKRLRKKYVGKSWEDWAARMAAKQFQLEPRVYRKGKFIRDQIKKGNKLAKEYKAKLEVDQVSTDWAYKVIVNDIRERRTWKMVQFAHKRNFEYNGPDELVGFIADQMRSKGLDPMNIEAFDSYLNSEFR